MGADFLSSVLSMMESSSSRSASLRSAGGKGQVDGKGGEGEGTLAR